MFPLEILTGVGSFILGFISKVVTMKMEMRHQEQKLLLAKAGLIEEARRHGKTDRYFRFTRRVIALTLLAAVTAPLWVPLIGDIFQIKTAIAIPILEQESKSSFLFGLFKSETKIIGHDYYTISYFLPEYKHYFWAVMGLYFGASRK